MEEQHAVEHTVDSKCGKKFISNLKHALIGRTITNIRCVEKDGQLEMTLLLDNATNKTFLLPFQF